MKIRLAPLWLMALPVLLASSCGLESGGKAHPEEAGLSAEHLRLLDGIIQEAVSRKDFPGAVLLVGRRGKIAYRKAFGECELVPTRRPMEERMIFDLASLTKPVATATSFMILVERGQVSLEEKVKEYVPEFAPFVDASGKPGEEARLWHLLTHTSGLAPYTDAAEAEKTLGHPCSMEDLVRYIGALPKICPAGAEFHYSCLGYITLARVLTKITGRTLAEFSRENIFSPLGMKNTFFQPAEKFRPLCVPTQVLEGRPLAGVVHDPLARLQGGISGNAGLFSTAEDLAVFAEMMLHQGTYGGRRILGPLTVERMTRVWQKAPWAGRGLGWDLDSSYSTNGGDIFGPNSYGHTGYTGTSLWIDPDTGTYVIFLTNRVHPDDQGTVTALRSRVANVVAASILEEESGVLRR